ncbi:hypothetical protein CLOM_g11290 [Closterium sp. NIES-68]|nr:hypothetical protein CLOM_g11290 [Closterium sp. NIES-68]GJP77956.1 hypothetical protein CLOP_g8276 [Closterium sp. NIES-67]
MHPSAERTAAASVPLSRATIPSSRPRLPRLALAPCLLLQLLQLLPPRIPAATAFAPDVIRSLPGQPRGAPPFGQWAGYIPVGPAGRKKLFYWLTESVAAPQTKPLVLWLNGGPGCSSIGYGLFEELGPWRVANDAGRQLQFNPFAWNKLANVLFVDSPAGTGFSYSLDPSDLSTGDNQTALDTVQLLRAFLRRHPRYNGRTLLLAGESYAGHYIPQVAALLLSLAARPAQRVRVRVGGVLLGNPFVHATIDTNARTQFFYDHGLVSPQLFSRAAQCHFSADSVLPGVSCDAIMRAVATADSGIDPYDIYAPVCLSPAYLSLGLTTQRLRLARLVSSSSPSHAPGARGARGARGGEGAAEGQGASVKGGGGKGGVEGAGAVRGVDGAAGAGSGEEGGGVAGAADPYVASRACMDVWVRRYLQRAAVQRAIHAMPSTPGARPQQWMACSAMLQYASDDMAASMLPLLRRIMQAHVPLWIMSGDTDSVVPFTGTRQWIAALNLPLISPLLPWTLPPTRQVGGWVTSYKGLTFVTVRGAGHAVPLSRPASAFTIFGHFLRGLALPTD